LSCLLEKAKGLLDVLEPLVVLDLVQDLGQRGRKEGRWGGREGERGGGREVPIKLNSSAMAMMRTWSLERETGGRKGGRERGR
jgi:hypothetical protein